MIKPPPPRRTARTDKTRIHPSPEMPLLDDCGKGVGVGALPKENLKAFGCENIQNNIQKMIIVAISESKVTANSRSGSAE
jgi:hypothetical protein